MPEGGEETSENAPVFGTQPLMPEHLVTQPTFAAQWNEMYSLLTAYRCIWISLKRLFEQQLRENHYGWRQRSCSFKETVKGQKGINVSASINFTVIFQFLILKIEGIFPCSSSQRRQCIDINKKCTVLWWKLVNTLWRILFSRDHWWAPWHWWTDSRTRWQKLGFCLGLCLSLCLSFLI